METLAFIFWAFIGVTIAILIAPFFAWFLEGWYDFCSNFPTSLWKIIYRKEYKLEEQLDNVFWKWRDKPMHGPEEYREPAKWKHYPDAIYPATGSPLMVLGTSTFLGHRHYRKERQ